MVMTRSRDELPLLNVQEVGGTGDTIVFLHGLGGTTRYWSSKLDGIELGGRIVLVDLLGFGDSPRPWFRYTIDRHIAPLRKALCDYEQIVLVGHSLGAALAVIYAARYPEQVKALVLMSLPNFQSRDRAYRWMRKRLRGWILTNMLTVGLACIITRRVTGKILPLILTDYPREVAEDVVKHNVLSSTTSLWNVIYGHDIHEDAARISPDMPVLCVHSEDDDTVPIGDVRMLVEEFPNWQLHAINGARHHPWLWNTDACISGMGEFFRLV